MAKVIKHNITYNSAPSTATLLPYDNRDSGLSATTVKSAIDELKSDVDTKADSADVPQDLADLDDVTISSVASGQILKYNGSNWVNANESTGSSSFADLTDVDLSNLQNGQVAKYNSTTQKWENANESSGASSLDDLTDVTITSPTANQELTYDGNGWENKTTRVELTQIEYDNLVAQGADLPDVDYYITDANGDGSQFQPIIYSGTEREVGVFTNGKPLYQRSWEFSTPIDIQNNSWVLTGIDCSTIDDIISVESVAGDGSSISLFASKNNTNNVIELQTPRNQYTTNCRVLTLRYTKTTDTAGSGTWTPQGVPAHHYSTDEHIVGTWIDGTSVYEKTFIFQEVVIPKETWTTVTDISSLNTDRLVSVFGNGSGASQVASINAFNNNGNLQVFLPFAWGISSITIQYTKSSS